MKIDWMARARTAILHDRQVIYDVAEIYGQIVDNVKHLTWFQFAVANRLRKDRNDA
jgi:hypothetical protein